VTDVLQPKVDSVPLGIAMAVLTVWLVGCRANSCDYAHPSCDPGHVCARTDHSPSSMRAECVQIEELDAPLRAPFVDGHAFACAHGPYGPLGRAFVRDPFAVDLSSRGADAGVVVAPIDGEAFVFDGCEERDDRPDAKNDSTCGAGYGNQVKIWDGQTLVLLAHLSKVTIKNGVVHAGQPVGVEGNSGAAGSRHLHIQVTRPGKGEDVRKIFTTPGWGGRVPVRFRLNLREREGAAVVVRSADELSCSDDAAARAFYWP
jgi:hypothetical protein